MKKQKMLNKRETIICMVAISIALGEVKTACEFAAVNGLTPLEVTCIQICNEQCQYNLK